MSKLYSYSGPPPQAMSGQLSDRVLDILVAQLKVLENMTQQVLLIPAGTRINEVKDDK